MQETFRTLWERWHVGDVCRCKACTCCAVRAQYSKLQLLEVYYARKF